MSLPSFSVRIQRYQNLSYTRPESIWRTLLTRQKIFNSQQSCFFIIYLICILLFVFYYILFHYFIIIYNKYNNLI